MIANARSRREAHTSVRNATEAINFLMFLLFPFFFSVLDSVFILITLHYLCRRALSKCHVIGTRYRMNVHNFFALVEFERARRKIYSRIINISSDFIVFERTKRRTPMATPLRTATQLLTRQKYSSSLLPIWRTKSIIIKIVEIQHVCLQPLDTTYFRSCVPHIYCLRMCLSVCLLNAERRV